jgi:hypothetical protein
MLCWFARMNFRTSLQRSLILVIALLIVEGLQSTTGFAASRERQTPPSSGLLFENLTVLSDFDGDNKVDQATLSSNGNFKSIHVVLGKSSSSSSLNFDSNVSDRGRLVSGDIDEDGDIDLVWISQNSREFITWLGDGRGHFTIGTAVKVRLDRIRALLGYGAQLVDGPNVAEDKAVLIRTSFIIPVINCNNLYIPVLVSVAGVETHAPGFTCFATLKQRAPPSILF